MTLPRWYAIRKYQRDTPPLHVVVASALAGDAGTAPSPSGVDENGQSLFDVIPRS